MQTTCDLCKQPLDTNEVSVHQWTAGWVKQRSAGGGHGISLPERANRWAHGYCVERLATGWDVNQIKLFSDDHP